MLPQHLIRNPCSVSPSSGHRAEHLITGFMYASLKKETLTDECKRNEGRNKMSMMDAFKLDGKKAYVTGGAKGIGKSIASALADAGADVAIVDIDIDESKKTADELSGKYGIRALAIKTDVTDPDDVNNMIQTILEEFGTIDIAFNNAGITLNTPTSETTLEEWKKVIDLNLTGVFLTSQAAGKVMLENGGGTIINTGSMSGHIVNVPQPQASYNASKAGVIHFSKSIAVEWADKNVRVNTISPGYIGTDLTLDAEELKPLIEEWKELTPVKRLGEPEELQGIAVYLASDASSFVTGSDFIIDGGYTAV